MAKTPPRIRPSIKKDPIDPAAYNNLKLSFYCEACSHFKSTDKTCTLGFKTEPHLKINFEKSYQLSGKVPLCRFHEID